MNYTLGCTVFELLPLLQLRSDGRDPADYSELYGSYLGALPVDRFPNLLAVSPTMLGRDEQEFDYGLAAVLRGIETLGPKASDPTR